MSVTGYPVESCHTAAKVQQERHKSDEKGVQMFCTILGHFQLALQS
jgi:hypothetical protein